MPRRKKYDRKEVLDKAMYAFWNGGYNATSVRTLEEKMGINQFSIYSSFKSKQGLFLESLNRYRTEVKEVYLKDMISSEGHVDDIRKFLYGFADAVKTGKTPNGCLMANTAMEIGSKDVDISQQLKQFFQFLKEAFINVLNGAQSNAEIGRNVNIDSYANYLVGCTEGLAVIAKIMDDEQISDFIDTTVNSLK